MEGPFTHSGNRQIPVGIDIHYFDGSAFAATFFGSALTGESVSILFNRVTITGTAITFADADRPSQYLDILRGILPETVINATMRLECERFAVGASCTGPLDFSTLNRRIQGTVAVRIAVLERL